MTKQNIIRIATLEFSKYGYDGLSMNNLASKLDVNKATIYYHFKDKKSLYQEVLSGLIKLNRDDLEDIIKLDIQPKEKLKRYIKIFVETICQNPEIVPLALREMANRGGNLDKAVDDELQNEIVILKGIVSQLDLKDKYKDIDYYELKAMIMGTVTGYHTMHMSDLNSVGLKEFNKDNNKIAKYLIEFLSNMLLDALCKD